MSARPGQLALGVPDLAADPLADLDLEQELAQRADWLRLVLSRPRPGRCQCIPHALVFADVEHSGARCAKCGHAPRSGPVEEAKA